ncbi:hypothetical protein H072_3980 [Dactylellina haptotyla CBS 200.50]|uniref:Uncharacterized protein n=1 Tax=Dactylellina haptotyla (strain CBS 200.50) TaxID=1284197 RepID=S8BRJ1_DACHA|nr:hypothetical protein H072_3980 [Dactylellina haptotyla CBS 200.50]
MKHFDLPKFVQKRLQRAKEKRPLAISQNDAKTSTSASSAPNKCSQREPLVVVPSIFPSLPTTKRLARANPTPSASRLQTLPTEILVQIVSEIGKILQKKTLLRGQKQLKIDRRSLLDFGLTCKRHLDVVLPELHRDAELAFPLEVKYVTRTKDIRRTGWYAQSLVLNDKDDPYRVYRPGDIFNFFPNLTNLKLNIRAINVDRALHMIHLALTSFKNLRDLSIEGPVNLVHVPIDDKIVTVPRVSLQSLSLVIRGIGSGSFIARLAELLEPSCDRLRKLTYRPFDYIEGNAACFNWSTVGYLMQSERLEMLKLHVPSGYFKGGMKFLQGLTEQQREKVEVLDLNFEESRLEIFRYGDILVREILAFPNLVRLRITHVHPVGLEPITVVERVLCAERLGRMFKAFTMELSKLKQVEWYESGYLGEEWMWQRDDTEPWEITRLTKRLDTA